MKEIINNPKKTLFIINSKYHELLYKYLLKQVPFLNNVSIKDIKHFTMELLDDTHLPYHNEPLIVRKLKLHRQLNHDNHDFANNINYLNELLKLEDEFNNSNVATVKEYQDLLKSQTYDFKLLTNPYDQIIILDKQDFFPVHHEIIEQLDNVIDYAIDNPWFGNETKATIWEHDNYTNMINGIIQSIVDHKHFKNTLIMVDNPTLKELISTSLNKLELAYTNLTKQNKIENNYLHSLFNYLNQAPQPYDLINIATLFKINLDPKTAKALSCGHIAEDNSDIGQLFKKIDFIIELDYQDYLQGLYNLLLEIDLHQIKRINELFSELYLLENDIDKKVLNKLLVNELKLEDDVSIDNDIVLAGSDFNALKFEHAYIVDASFPDLKPAQTSTLLNTNQRLAVSDKLINNLYLNNQFDTKLHKISNVALDIQYHYSLVDFSNKSLSLKPFISDQKLPIATPEQYLHYTTKDTIKADEYPDRIQVDPAKVITSLSYDDKINLSASALDTFNSCQYQYYIKYIIKPKLNKKFDNLFAGNLLHQILEDLNNMIIANNGNYDFLTTAIINKTIDDNFQLLDEHLTKELFVSTNLITLLKTQVAKIVIRHISNMQTFQQYSAYQIHSSEQRLSYDYPNDYLDNVTVMGRIDALFKHDEFYYVLDYKSSYKEFKIQKFNEGNHNQLMMYLYLLNKNAYQFTGAFFMRLANHYRDIKDYLDDSFIDDKEKLSGILLNDDLVAFDSQYQDDVDGLLTIFKNNKKKDEFENNKVNDLGNILELFKQLETSYDGMLQQLSLGLFKINPLDAKVCEYCDYASLCHERLYEEDDINE